MTTLLPDDSYCTSELGRLLFQSKTEWNGRAYVSDAKEISQLGVKFVEYTCVIVMTPKQALELDERTFVLQTRYKTMNKLHSALRKLHSQLYLKCVFPSFPEAKWIGGNDAATITERKAATETFLTFLLSQEVLRKSRILHQFIESAEERVPEGELIDANSTITSGTGLLDSTNVISAEVAPVMTPDNDSLLPSSSHSSLFHFDDVSIDETLTMSNQGRGFLREYLSKFTKKTDESDGYLVEAARLVSTAQLAESEGAFEAAFYSFKEAANVLIKGMESEKSLSTRNAVRLKSAKYIEKAEQIYRNHLRYDNAPLFDMRHMPRDNQDELAFRSSNSGLKSFRFMGVLPDIEAKKRVFLVQETESGGEFVMKLIERREGDVRDGIFLPTNVPHMVQLIKFYTTTNYIILLLQYVKTGRLWSFLCRYLAESDRKYEEKERNEAEEEFVENEVRNRENPYRGRHTRFCVTADCERLAVMENDGLEEGAAVVCSVGEDVMGGEGDEERARYLLVPSDTANATTMIVEEEAPAPVTISMIGEHEEKKKNKKEGGEWENDRLMNLAEAMAECREYLKESKRCWSGVLPESLIIHWSAQCISMLYVLHSHKVYIGDLHPDNLLIDEEGNLLFTYQTKWSEDERERHFLAGYTAPECSLMPSTLTPSCDVWSLGALLYELIVGRPLACAAPHGIGYLSELPSIPESAHISFSARDILSRILQIDPLERITIDQIRCHPFYSSIDWLLYDNPHGPARVGVKQTKTARERVREGMREEEKKEQEKIEKRQAERARIAEEEMARLERELAELDEYEGGIENENLSETTAGRWPTRIQRRGQQTMIVSSDDEDEEEEEDDA
ncbi:hypothetical protein PFISCL1PPCAC_1922, partial [Pristionchus fissidentatus]